MIVHQRIDNEFEWLPAQSNLGNIDTQSISERTRNPIFWLKQHDDTIYFINGSSEKLDLVIASAFDKQSPEVAAQSLPEKRGYFYDNQSPNQAVKVFEYKDSADRSLSVELCLHIKSKHHGTLKISIAANDNGLYPVVLLWNTGEVGKGIDLVKSSV